MRDITYGQIRGDKEPNQLAVAVDHLIFPTLPSSGPLPPQGTTGTLTTKSVPKSPYVVKQTIWYEDGNNNNTLRMTVTSVVGPAKYNIRVG